MTEREILKLQEQTGNQDYYLVSVGSFLHAYGNGAFALARATGYRVMRKKRKWGEVLTVGFPANRLDQVRQRVREAGGDMEQIDQKTYLFRGVDGLPDEQMVSLPASHSPKGGVNPTPVHSQREGRMNEIVAAIRDFNLSMSTPMDAMLLIGTLQQRLQQTDENNDDACESPAGQGLQE